MIRFTGEMDLEMLRERSMTAAACPKRHLLVVEHAPSVSEAVNLVKPYDLTQWLTTLKLLLEQHSFIPSIAVTEAETHVVA